MSKIYIPDSARPYNIEFIDQFIAKLAGIDHSSVDEKRILVDNLNDHSIYKRKLSARIAYNDFSLERLMLVLQIEKIMNYKPDYSLSSDVYNTLENSSRGLRLSYINPWTNLKQNPTLNAFVFYIKKLMIAHVKENHIDDNYSMILSYTGSRDSGRPTKSMLLKSKCNEIGIKYNEIELRYGKNPKKWIYNGEVYENSVENCVIMKYAKDGWNGSLFNKSILHRMQNNTDYVNTLKYFTPQIKEKLDEIFYNIDISSSGLPDIILWKDNELAFCEVKEPHDDLKQNQIDIARSITGKNLSSYYLTHIIGCFE